MQIVGLTGGIGSGKSTVLQMLAACGAGVIDADAISRGVTASGGAAIAAIAQRFGVALKDLLRWNGLDMRAIVHPGQSLRLED